MTITAPMLTTTAGSAASTKNIVTLVRSRALIAAP